MSFFRSKFRVKDLMINLIPEGILGGGTALPGPDDPTPPSPISPVAMVARMTPQFRDVVEKAGTIEKLTPEIAEGLASKVGEAAVAGLVMSEFAQCTIDMPTCDNNEWLSRVAHATPTLTADDEVVVEVVLNELLENIAKNQEMRLDSARERGNELVPQLEEAIAELRGRGKS